MFNLTNNVVITLFPSQTMLYRHIHLVLFTWPNVVSLGSLCQAMLYCSVHLVKQGCIAIFTMSSNIFSLRAPCQTILYPNVNLINRRIAMFTFSKIILH
jgi:hypothetical protein